MQKDVELAKVAMPKWTHSNKIAELETDSNLSYSYLQKIAKNSKKEVDLNHLLDYLKDRTKISNLSGEEIRTLTKMIKAKLKNLADQELLKEILKAAKTKGTTLINSIDHFQDFI